MQETDIILISYARSQASELRQIKKRQLATEYKASPSNREFHWMTSG
jgi:hypothetical protein